MHLRVLNGYNHGTMDNLMNTKVWYRKDLTRATKSLPLLSIAYY